MRLAFFIVGILVTQNVVGFSQSTSNVEQIWAVVHSNDLVFLNASNSSSASNLFAAYTAYRQGKASKGAMMILAQRAANAEPQDLYGMVIDQRGQPISGADVIGNLAVMGGLGDGAKNQTFKLQSNTNGLFQFADIKGRKFFVTVKKAGYAMMQTKGPMGRNSSPNDRETFSMWKLQGAEPLVGINKTFKLPYTAAPMNFDLIAGQTVPSGGDLRITVNRPAGVISGRNPQDWNIDIEVVDGGFIETSPEDSATTYIAPENGYQSSGTFGKNNGPDLVDKMLFIQSRNGQVYSKVHLLFGINKIPNGIMYITFSGVANTNSSRNWEATAPQ